MDTDMIFRIYEAYAQFDLFSGRVKRHLQKGELCPHEVKLSKSFLRRWRGLSRALVDLLPYWEKRTSFPTGPAGTEVDPSCGCTIKPAHCDD